MAISRRGPCLAALAVLALTFPAGGLGAQDNSFVGPPDTVVGPPELSNFQLGPRATQDPPAAEAPPPATATPPSASGQQQPIAVPAPPPVTLTPPSPVRTQPIAPAVSRPRTVTRDATPAPTVESPLVANTPPDIFLPEPAPFAPPEPRPRAIPAAAAPAGVPFWVWPALAGLVALLGFVALRRRRSTFEPATLGPATMPAPAPVPPRPAAPVRKEPAPRPQLELEFRPERASITDSEAVIHFDLRIRNVGQAATRYLRIDARLFNAGTDQDQEIGAFFSAPVRDKNAALMPRAIPPQGEIRLPSTVTMAREDMREIELQGRRLFIPVLAFNLVYEWGDTGSGQTALSYLVGREAEPPSERMGPFRLDLGPRVYRSVGQRQNKSVRRF